MRSSRNLPEAHTPTMRGQRSCWMQRCSSIWLRLSGCRSAICLKRAIRNSAIWRSSSGWKRKRNRSAGLGGSNDFVLLLLGGGAFVGRALLVFVFHCGFETANTFSDSFAEFRKLLRAEHEQSDSEDHQQMHGLKKSFEHFVSLSFLRFLSITEFKRCARRSGHSAPWGRW